MNKILIITLILLGVTFALEPALCRTVTVTKNVPDSAISNNAYSADLAKIENYLFGKTYKKESTASRINRIEQKLFNKNYASMNVALRMNNILANYKNYNSNYLSEYYNNSTPVSRIRNRYVGVPTGYTPPVYNYNYGNLNGINRSFTSNRGYAYNNSIPMTTGAGIHILP